LTDLTLYYLLYTQRGCLNLRVTDVFRLKLHQEEGRLYFVSVRSELFSFVFSVIKTMHKYDFRRIMNETNTSYVMQWYSDLFFWRDLCVFHRWSLQVLNYCTHAVMVNCILLS